MASGRSRHTAPSDLKAEKQAPHPTLQGSAPDGPSLRTNKLLLRHLQWRPRNPRRGVAHCPALGYSGWPTRSARQKKKIEKWPHFIRRAIQTERRNQTALPASPAPPGQALHRQAPANQPIYLRSSKNAAQPTRRNYLGKTVRIRTSLASQKKR